MTSNSAASFFLLAIFAGLGLCVQALRQKKSQETLAALTCYILAFAVVLFGLFLTQSKGGIGAFALGLLLFVIMCAFGKTLLRYRRIVFIMILLLAVLAAGAVIHYGIQLDRLPGGNSMLVRWQYWTSASEMIRDHPWSGVGGGNFSQFYTHYKIPAASETVQDPHNWMLSLLSQYGLFGFLAFVLAVFLPAFKSTGQLVGNAPQSRGKTAPEKKLGLAVLAVALGTLLFIRPVLVDAAFLYQAPDVRASAYLVLYLIPAACFVLTYMLLFSASHGDASHNSGDRHLMIALGCGLIAVFIHNLIDFAIFEPGIFSLLWLFIAMLAAHGHNQADGPEDVVALDAKKRFGVFAGIVVVSVVYLGAVLVPPIRAERFFKQAVVSDLNRGQLFEAAVDADTLSPKAAYRIAGLCLESYQSTHFKNDTLLIKAVEFAHIAAARNPADFKPWRLLAQIQALLAEQAEDGQKEKHFQEAFDSLQEATTRYPGSGRLHYFMARIAEQLNRNDAALCHYTMAVEIEDAYRAQFRVMYPDRETVISRLGKAAYDDAEVRIEELQRD